MEIITYNKRYKYKSIRIENLLIVINDTLSLKKQDEMIKMIKEKNKNEKKNKNK